MTNIVYPTQCAVFFLKETSTISDSVLLTLPSNLGLVFGEILLMLFGTRLGRNGCWYVFNFSPILSSFKFPVRL